MRKMVSGQWLVVSGLILVQTLTSCLTNDINSSIVEVGSSSSNNTPLCEDKEYNPETHYCYYNECGRPKSCDVCLDATDDFAPCDMPIECPTVCVPRWEVRKIEACCPSVCSQDGMCTDDCNGPFDVIDGKAVCKYPEVRNSSSSTTQNSSASKDLGCNVNLNINGQTEINLGETACTSSYGGLTLQVIEVRDSRCPSDVVCAWEGNAEVDFALGLGVTTKPFGFTLNTNYRYQRDTIINPIKFKLVDVQPYPKHILLPHTKTVTVEVEPVRDNLCCPSSCGSYPDGIALCTMDCGGPREAINGQVVCKYPELKQSSSSSSSLCCIDPECPECDVCAEPLVYEYVKEDCTKGQYVYCPMMRDRKGACLSNSNQIPPGGGCIRDCGKDANVGGVRCYQALSLAFLQNQNLCED